MDNKHMEVLKLSSDIDIILRCHLSPHGVEMHYPHFEETVLEASSLVSARRDAENG